MKLNVVGTIDDEKGISIDFTEKNVIKIEVEFGNKKLFYEVNDEFNNYKKIVERLKKQIAKLEELTHPELNRTYPILIKILGERK